MEPPIEFSTYLTAKEAAIKLTGPHAAPVYLTNAEIQALLRVVPELLHFCETALR